jgi:hypothetical protein
MAAKDYKICPGLMNCYIAKVSKTNPNKMLEDRRPLEEHEIMMIIDWWIRNKVEDSENNTQVITAGGKPIIEVTLLDKK